MDKHKLNLSPAKMEAEAVENKSPADASGTDGVNMLGGDDDMKRLASEHANPDTINALDIDEGKGLMAYTHIGCSDHAITLRPLPAPVR
jgi:hypothetical protein